MSVHRLRVFQKCTKQNEGARDANGIDNTYPDMLDDQTAQNVAGWLKQQGGIRTVKGLLTYNGMANAAKIMCRWPHPTEVAQMATSLLPLNTQLPTIYCLQVELRDDEGRGMYQKLAKFAGPMGANFAQMGITYNLMYVWLDKDDETHTLFMYALSEAALKTALVQGVYPAADELGIEVDDVLVFPYILNNNPSPDITVSKMHNGWPRATVSRVSGDEYVRMQQKIPSNITKSNVEKSNAVRALNALVEPRLKKSLNPRAPSFKPAANQTLAVKQANRRATARG